MKADNITIRIDVDKEELDKSVAKIESAFPKIIFSGNVKNVYVNYTQNNFNESEADK